MEFTILNITRMMWNDIKALATEHNLFITGGSDYHGIPGKAPDKFGDYLVSSENVSEFISLL